MPIANAARAQSRASKNVSDTLIPNEISKKLRAEHRQQLI
jgi:hypothetical protein